MSTREGAPCSVRRCRGHWHVTTLFDGDEEDLCFAGHGDQFATPEEAQAVADRLNRGEPAFPPASPPSPAAAPEIDPTIVGVKSVEVEDGRARIKLTVSEQVATMLAGVAFDILESQSAENYVEMLVAHPTTGDFATLTVRRTHRPTPHELRRQAEERARTLQGELEEMRADAERWRFLRDRWPTVSLTWVDEETGNFGGEHGDVPLYARTPTITDDATDKWWQGATPDEAIDAARAALTPGVLRNGVEN